MKDLFKGKKIYSILFILILAVLGYFMLVGFGTFFSYVMKFTKLENFKIIASIFTRFTLLLIWIFIARLLDVKVKILWNFRTFIYGIGLLAPLVFITYSRFVNSIIEYSGNKFNYEEFTLNAIFYLLVGAFEEYWFRGVIYNLMRDSFPNASKFKLIIFQGILFGIDHFFSYLSSPQLHRQGLEHVINATIIGIIFGMAYELSNSLLAITIVHAFWDLATGFGLFYENSIGTFEVAEEIKKYTITLGIIVAALTYLESLVICKDRYYNDYDYMIKRRKIPKFIQDIIDEMYV